MNISCRFQRSGEFPPEEIIRRRRQMLSNIIFPVTIHSDNDTLSPSRVFSQSTDFSTCARGEIFTFADSELEH